MQTTAAPCLPRALPRPSVSPLPRRLRLPPLFRIVPTRTSRKTVPIYASAASFDDLDAKGWTGPMSAKKSVLSDQIQEIEPLDTSLIQKDVPAVTVDAMKRTISGMLGILPSDRFNVMVEALWERLFKLFVSSMMTGYTLRNAEYRLSIERILEKVEDHHYKEEHLEKDDNKVISCGDPDKLQDTDSTPTPFQLSGRDGLLSNSFKGEVPVFEDINYECLGELSTEAKECIQNLKSRLSALEKELHEARRKNYALQMQQFVGEEKNDLLDYLRSLKPEKVVELSEPTSPEVQEIVHSIAHGLLATLSPKMHSKPPLESDGCAPGGAASVGKDDRAEMLENASVHLHPHVVVPRDYLARLLFWCLLLGHHLRGLEHRLELMQLLTVAGNPS